MPHRGNCCELYGFDILIDDDLKPWVLEVNLSPSMATDAPIDLKIKSNVIADFFNIMGVEVTDPLSRRNKESRMNPNLPYSKSQKAQQNTNSNNNSSERANGAMSAEDAKLIRWVKDQNDRRGGFVRIFPRPETWSAYGGLLELKTNTNELLAQRLFPDTYRPGSAVVRTRHLGKPAEGERFNQYERRLQSLDKKTRRRKKTRRKGATRGSIQQKTENDDEIEDETDEQATSTMHNLATIPPHQPILQPTASGDTDPKLQMKLQKKSIEKSEIYKSIRDAREKKKHHDALRLDPKYITPPPKQHPPQKDGTLDISHVDERGDTVADDCNDVVLNQIVKKLKLEAAKLCQVEAREAFATYLHRVQQRFVKESAQRGRADHRTG